MSARASGSSRSDDVDRRAVLPLRLALVEQQVLRCDVVDAAEMLGVADRPVHRRGGDAERALDVVEQLERIARRAIELVDESENRQAMAPADLEQLARLLLDAVGRVDHHHDAVGGDERAIRVLAEVLVARRIEQRHAPPFELELERRGGDRDAALLLERHPVGGRMLAAPCGRAPRRQARSRRRRAAASRSASSCRRRGAR